MGQYTCYPEVRSGGISFIAAMAKCKEHHWVTVAARKTGCPVWNHVRREDCRVCEAVRWLCARCQHVAYVPERKNLSVSNVSRHLLSQDIDVSIEEKAGLVAQQPTLFLLSTKVAKHKKDYDTSA